MATFNAMKLSGSTDGRNTKVAATATPGTLIHTAQASATDEDFLFLWACNTDTTDRKLTIEFGGVTSPDDLMEVTIPAEGGWVPVVEGLPIRNSLVVRAFAASANVVNVNGYAVRKTS